MTILFQMQPVEKELVVRCHILWQWRFCSHLGLRHGGELRRRVAQKNLLILLQRDFEVLPSTVPIERAMQWRKWVEIAVPNSNLLALTADADDAARHRMRHLE